MKKIVSTGLSLILILISFFSFAVVATAADLSATLDFITDVRLTDRAGDELGDDIERDAEIILWYSYRIPNELPDDSDVNEGDTFTMDIPAEIAVSAPGDVNLVDDESGQIIGTGHISTDNTIVVTFTSFVDIYSNIHGEFWFELALCDDNIGYDEPETITFNVGASTEPYVIEINFEQPAPPEASIEKSGTYDEDTNEITWRITVNPEELAIHDVQVTDEIADGQTFVPGSVTIGDPASAADPANYDYTDGVLTYTFDGTVSTEQVITFRVTLDDSEFQFEDAHGETVTEGNSATFYHDGEVVVSNAAEVDVPVNYIDKSGYYDGIDRQIDWTVTINSNGVSIPDALLTDQFPGALDTASFVIDGVPIADITADTNFTLTAADTFTYAFGAIDEPHTITYSTDVDPDRYETNGSTTYTNRAWLTGTDVPDNADDSVGIGVTSRVVRKTGVSYDPATAEIVWRIYVNENAITIDDCVITDEIGIGQEYVTDSATISGGADASGFAYTAADLSDTEKTGTLTYTFSGSISEAYTITFRTRATVDEDISTNKSTRYYNTAKIGGSNIPDSESTGNRMVTSNVINKDGTDYDFVTKRVTWEIVVNDNEMPLDGVVVTDHISDGQEYVAGSAMISGGADASGFAYDSGSKTLTYTFSGTITDTYTITFETQITDTSIFAENGDVTISNAATLTHDAVPGDVETSGSQTVTSTVISKEGDYTTGNQYIDWTVIVNVNNIPLSSGVITDQFEGGLTLDTVSVQLFHLVVHADGSTEAGTEIPLDGDNVVYDFDTRTLNFSIPTPISGGYMLTYRTIVTDKEQSPFSNEASFAGTGTVQRGESDPINVGWSGSGSTGTGEVGSITVYKVDSDNTSKYLEGCEFTLLDRYGNVSQRSITDGTGSVLFNWLRFDVNYTVVETSPPEGYLPNDEEYTFQIASSADEKDIEYTYADESIKGRIILHKYDMSMRPVENTGFTLYAADDTTFENPLATAYSNADGEVVFEDVPYGSYVIRETDPATGYYGSEDTLSAEIDTDGEVIDAGYIQNEAMLGTILLTKTEGDGETPLAGALMGLYRVGADTPVQTQRSDADGAVMFENVVIGDYVIREIEAPEGYALSDQELEVSLTEDGQTLDAGDYINDRLSTIILTKVGEDEKTPLAGALMGLYVVGEDTPLQTQRSDDTGAVVFEEVVIGDYVIREIDAPTGYSLSERELEVALTENGDTVDAGTFVNEKIHSPETGDNVGLYIALCAVGLAGLATVIIADRVKRKRRRQV